MTQPKARIALPSARVAPGIRSEIRNTAYWHLVDATDDHGFVEPFEGAGVVRKYFTVTRLCGSRTTITDETWAPLVENPPARVEGHDPPTTPGGPPDSQWRAKLEHYATTVAESGQQGADLVAVDATLMTLEPSRAATYLTKHAPEFFSSNRGGSFWFFRTDPVLPRRLGVLRVLLPFELLPDYAEAVDPKAQTHPRIMTLQEHSLTDSYFFDRLLDPILLALPPAALGYTFSWPPHGLLFEFGVAASLLASQRPPTFASVYQPEIQESAHMRWEGEFVVGIPHGQIESLVQWWVSRLNVIYSHATDPTGFVSPDTGLAAPSRMVSWLLTFERMLADYMAIASAPQGAPIIRLTMAFDLLDKAEALLGYGRSKSGEGAKQLMNRRVMVRRLDSIWDRRLPVQLRPRFKAHGRWLYDQMYAKIADGAYDYRQHKNGIKVWSPNRSKLDYRTWDSYVPDLVRGVRNSAHGLLEALDRKERGAVEIHSGQLPPEFADLACFLALALVADAERLCAGSWLKPV